MAASNELARVQQHLNLLREQYVKLQQRHSDLEQKYTRAIATSGDATADHFVSRLLKMVADLYDKSLYSDIDIVLADRKMPGHRFVLAARSRRWNQDETLTSTSELDLSHMTPFVAGSMIRWVYTDSIILPSEQTAMIELLSAANKYHLPELKEKCEQALISSVTVRNCIKLYQTSEEHAAQNLKTYCLQMISSHWNNLNTSDFAELSAPLLYDMFKAHSEYPLHLAIQHQREDVVFLFLIEFNSQLPHKLNEFDNEGNIPLNLALLDRNEGIANTLVSHSCDLDLVDPSGNSLLHLAITRGDTFSASFLIKNGANTILARKENQETPLHLVASYKPSQALTTVSSVSVKEAPWPSESMAGIASLLLDYHANPDAQDSAGFTPLQRAIQCQHEDIFTILLTNPVLNLDLRNHDHETALWLALMQLDADYLSSEDITDYEHTFATRLIKRGANPDSTESRTGNSLLHKAALQSNEAAAVFLVHHGAVPNGKNNDGEAPIHIAARNGLDRLVNVLLQHGADPNLQTAIKPKQAPPPLSLPPAEAGSESNLSTAASSMTKLEEYGGGGGASGVQVGGGMVSPTTLGALSALSTVTSQSVGGYGLDGGPGGGAPSSGYSSLGGQTPQQMSHNLMMMSSMMGVVPPAAARDSSPAIAPKKGNTSLNPFGSDSDDEEEAPAVAEYRVSPLPRGSGQGPPGFQYRGLGVGGGGSRGGSRGGSAQNSPGMAQGHFRYPPSAASSLTRRTESPVATPLSPRTALAEAQEFIDVAEEIDLSSDPGGRTALHLAIVHKHSKVIDVLLQHKGTMSSGKLEIGLNVNLRDGNNETALSLSLWTDQFEVAGQLLKQGADIECLDMEESGLLYISIMREKADAALFLLDNGADFKKRTPQNETLLLIAIRHQLEKVADKLCEMGVDLSMADTQGNSPLWVALRSRQETIATKLIVHGCDPNAWHMGPDGTTLTLLHRAILLRDKATACFLIKNGADVNSPSRPSSSSRENGGKPGSPIESLFAPPLHMACERGLQEVVQCLVDHHADVNTKDSTGRTALHVSISCKQPRCSDILLQHPEIDLTIRDKSGNTPFAMAMSVKDNEAGEAILKREPKAAEQIDSKGQNFLHLAVINGDVEGLIFLLSVRADVNSKVQSPSLNTPLHYAVKSGNEILVRHLLLAGARVMDIDNHQCTVLHMAVEGDFPTILSILLENAADPDSMDEDGNNPLHMAVQLGHMNCVRVLLDESNVSLRSINMKGQNILHILAKYAKENASGIFGMILEVSPGFPVDLPDADGNSPLLLAYIGGSTSLCDSLIQAGAHPGRPNRQGISIFNAPVATKQMLFRILEQIRMEPNWLEGNFCQNCNQKFSISNRKHHCRHCGRLLCKQCTSSQMPILKFDLSKPVRVCEVCADSFRLGATR